jgi:hypothetical protein
MCKREEKEREVEEGRRVSSTVLKLMRIDGGFHELRR